MPRACRVPYDPRCQPIDAENQVSRRCRLTILKLDPQRTNSGIIFATRSAKEKTMAKAGTLHDAFVDELRDTYDAEKQLTKALAKMAKTATSPDLKEAFEAHLEETRGQIERLDQVFASL